MGLIAKLSRQSAEYYAKTGEYMPIAWQLPQELLRQRACYVSIIEQPGRYVLGSFGNPLPRKASLAEEIIYNTVEAIVQHNIRMRSIDITSYTYSVGVLGALERITGTEHLQPLLYGLYVRSDRDKSALLLPRRTGIETPEEQIATAIREAGIDEKNESMTMYRFPVTFYE